MLDMHKYSFSFFKKNIILQMHLVELFSFELPWRWLLSVCLCSVSFPSNTIVGTLKRSMSLSRLTRKRARSKSTDLDQNKVHSTPEHLWVVKYFLKPLRTKFEREYIGVTVLMDRSAILSIMIIYNSTWSILIQ